MRQHAHWMQDYDFVFTASRKQNLIKLVQFYQAPLTLNVKRSIHVTVMTRVSYTMQQPITVLKTEIAEWCYSVNGASWKWI